LISLLSKRDPITVPALNILIRWHGERYTTFKARIGANSTSFNLASRTATVSAEGITIVTLLGRQHKVISANGRAASKSGASSQGYRERSGRGNGVTRSRASAHALVEGNDGRTTRGRFSASGKGSTTVSGTFVEIFARLSRTIRASVTTFDLTGGRATISRNFVTIVALFASGFDAITANGKARRSRSGANETSFDFAGGRATISRYGVTVVASLRRNNLLVSTHGGTRFAGLGANVTAFDLTSGRATISRDGVTIVALFGTLDQTITADCFANRSASETSLDEANAGATISRDGVTVIANRSRCDKGVLAPSGTSVRRAARVDFEGGSAETSGGNQILDETAQLVPISVGEDLGGITSSDGE